MVIITNMINFVYKLKRREMSNNTLDNTSQIELFQRYCSLLKKQDFDNANILSNEINWFSLIKGDCLYVLKSVPVITEDLLLNIFCSRSNHGLWNFYIDFFILKARIRRKMSPKVEAYGWKFVYQMDYPALDDRFILVYRLSQYSLSDRMTSEELNYYNQFPEEFTVYRGTNEEEFESKKFGVSWTSGQKVAEYFAFREEEWTSLRSKRIVLAATVRKADIVTCLLDRNEYEFIIDPKRLLDIHVLLNQRTDLYDIYADEVRNFRL